MSKIVVAVNVMIMNPEKITSVIHGSYEDEVFFLYDKKHKWSLFKKDDNIILSYYPGANSLELLASISPENWGPDIDAVVYNSKEIGTKEAKASFNELYTLLQGKKYGMDEILDEIIASDIPF